MNAPKARTYRVYTTELLLRIYLVTTPGGESRAAELAEFGDYGLTETVELVEDGDLVDFSVTKVAAA